MTQTEKTAAQWFLNGNRPEDPSLKAMAQLLSVSEATLVRFAKKCGFRGYREFMYQYQKSLAASEADTKVTDSTLTVLDAYQTLLTNCYSLIDEAQISRIAEMISSASRICVGGLGSSGLAAKEMAYRLMRVGYPMEAVDDLDMLRMTAVFKGENDLVIGLSLSSSRPEFLEYLRTAKERGARTILITSNRREQTQKLVDELVLVPSLVHMNWGHFISPQFPFLVMTDILYAACMQTNRREKQSLHGRTLKALNERSTKE